jgi:two-component sensor histidine kinase
MLYKSEDFTRINLKRYLEDLLHSMLYDQLEDLELDLCSVHCSTTTCIHVGMILNEIVLNALKYAYPLEEARKPFLCRTSLEKRRDETDRLHLFFRDFGVGIPDGVIESLEQKSLGFRIIRTLVKQRKGEIHIYNDQGCIYDLSIEL